MKTKRRRKPAAGPESGGDPVGLATAPSKALLISLTHGASDAEHHKQAAAQVISPEMAAARIVAVATRGHTLEDVLDVPALLKAMREGAAQVSAGDMRPVEERLWMQAVALEALSARFIERASSQQWLPQTETFFRLGLKAQAQSRQTLETLANVRNGPTIYARQANVAAGGPMQVNNGLSSPAGARQTENPPNQLLEAPYGERLDTGTAREAGAGDPTLETVDAKHRA